MKKTTPTEIDQLVADFIDSFQVPLFEFLYDLEETELLALKDEISKLNGTGKYDLIYDIDMVIG